MNIIWFMIPISIGLGLFFLICFIKASRDNQFEDLETPALRMLIDDTITETQTKDTQEEH